jgi:ParB-like chromosome segregation protein Spo0J
MSIDPLPASSTENYSDDNDDYDNGAVLLALQLGHVAANDEDIFDWVPLSSLHPADSPRLEGLDSAHAETLAEIEAELPPILVQRSTMRVIDGMHRLGAARIRGHEKILVQFVDCDEFDAFLVAVASNIKHGLPLTLADRRAAAERIVGQRPEASDRSIAELSGLAAKTVAAIRRNSGDPLPHATRRLGRDGRIRPLNATEGRRLAQELLATHPEASLRQIARHAGISVGTARDVRERVRQGIDPILSRTHVATARHVGGLSGLNGRKTAEPVDYGAILHRLRTDPAIRYTENGRHFLRWLSPPRLIEPTDWRKIVGCIPPHCTFDIIRIARSCAAVWSEFADELDRYNRESDEAS